VDDAGFVIGLVIGMAIGFAAGRKQKPWSEFTKREKKIRIGILTALSILVIAGIVVFFLVV